MADARDRIPEDHAARQAFILAYEAACQAAIQRRSTEAVQRIQALAEQFAGGLEAVRLTILHGFGQFCRRASSGALAERVWTQALLASGEQETAARVRASLWFALADLYLDTDRPGLSVVASRQGMALAWSGGDLRGSALARPWRTWMAAMRRQQHGRDDLTWFTRN